MFLGGERGHQLSTYATVGGMGKGGVDHPKRAQLRTDERDVTPHVYLRTYTSTFTYISFHVFDSIFVL